VPSQRNGYSVLRTLYSALRTPRSALCARAFTLVEMLTVIAIIGILAAILITAVPTVMRNARIATAKADISHLYQAATSYQLDFGAFPPDCTAFWTNGQVQQPDCPFPGVWNNQSAPYNASLSPNELLMWYLTMQYSTGQLNPVTNSYPASGYPAGYPADPTLQGNWPGSPSSPSAATVVFSHGVNAGPYYDMKAKQKTDVNANGFWEFMDPWGRPYMYRAYPQFAQVIGATPPPNSAPYTVILTLGNLAGPSPYGPEVGTVCNTYTYYGGYNFYANSPLAGTTGSIQLTGFSNPLYNGTFAFQGVPYNQGTNPNNNQVVLTFAANPGPAGTPGYYSFPLHNKQTCDIYSLGPYGLTRAASSMPNANNAPQEWKPTHGGTSVAADMALKNSSLDATSLDAWAQVWGTPGDGNDINVTSGNIIVNVQYQDNICNWN